MKPNRVLSFTEEERFVTLLALDNYRLIINDNEYLDDEDRAKTARVIRTLEARLKKHEASR